MNILQKFTNKLNNQPYLALLVTLFFVIIIRELCVLICRAIGMETASNIVGMVFMLLLLISWRLKRGWHNGLPSWLTDSSSRWLKDSGFAFLPVSAGAGLLLFGLGDELWSVIVITLISTLFPLWGFAYLANRWFTDDNNKQNSYNKGTL